MTLVVSLVRTVSSAKFICCCWRNPLCDCHVTHTPKCNKSAKIGQIINCGLTILSLFFLCCLGITTKLRFGAVDKMAGFFTKRIWQPCISQPNELKQEIKKKRGGGKPVSSKISDLCEISDLLLFFNYFASQNKEIMPGTSFFDVCCAN